MSQTTRTTDEPLGAVVHRLAEQIPELVRSELRLAQAELSQNGKKAGIGIGMFSVAGLLAFLALGTLVATAVVALALVLPAWAAGLVVAATLLSGAGLVAFLGTKEVHAATSPAPKRAIAGLHDDVQTIRGKHL